MMLDQGWPLVGVAVGNGFVEPAVQVDAFAPYAFATGFVDAAGAALMTRQQNLVKTLIAANRLEEASEAYDNVTLTALNSGGWFNPADIRVFGFPDFSLGEKWVEANRASLGVPSWRAPFEMCNDTVNDWFAAREMLSVAPLYADLLDRRGLRLLFFNGDMDFTVPTPGVEAWLAGLAWSGATSFAAAKRTVWRFDAKDPFAVAGFVRQSGPLTLAAVVNAGHSVCQDQQARSREMMAYFVANKPFPQGTPFPPSKRRRNLR